MEEKAKKKMGRPPVDTEPVVVRMPRGILEALDQHRLKDIGTPSRPEIIRRIVAEWLDENQEPKLH
jgi:metal-responsive CopG/Arc/MetJ family transcriptional regulator